MKQWDAQASRCAGRLAIPSAFLQDSRRSEGRVGPLPRPGEEREEELTIPAPSTPDIYAEFQRYDQREAFLKGRPGLVEPILSTKELVPCHKEGGGGHTKAGDKFGGCKESQGKRSDKLEDNLRKIEDNLDRLGKQCGKLNTQSNKLENTIRGSQLKEENAREGEERSEMGKQGKNYDEVISDKLRQKDLMAGDQGKHVMGPMLTVVGDGDTKGNKNRGKVGEMQVKAQDTVEEELEEVVEDKNTCQKKNVICESAVGKIGCRTERGVLLEQRLVRQGVREAKLSNNLDRKRSRRVAMSQVNIKDKIQCYSLDVGPMRNVQFRPILSTLPPVCLHKINPKHTIK